MSKTYLFLGGPKNGKLLEVPDHMIINNQIGMAIRQPEQSGSIFIYEVHLMLDADGSEQLCATVPGEPLPTPDKLTAILSR